MSHPSKDKISTEDKELLSSLPHLDVYKPLIRLLNVLVEDQGNAILASDLSQTDDRNLTLAKARFDGAAKIVRELHTVLLRVAKKPE